MVNKKALNCNLEIGAKEKSTSQEARKRVQVCKQRAITNNGSKSS
jgi:hypothetical protein